MAAVMFVLAMTACEIGQFVKLPEEDIGVARECAGAPTTMLKRTRLPSQ